MSDIPTIPSLASWPPEPSRRLTDAAAIATLRFSRARAIAASLPERFALLGELTTAGRELVTCPMVFPRAGVPPSSNRVAAVTVASAALALRLFSWICFIASRLDAVLVGWGGVLGRGGGVSASFPATTMVLHVVIMDFASDIEVEVG